MKPFPSHDRILAGLALRHSRKAGAFGSVLVVAGAFLLLFFVWPYATLWRIDKAVRDGDMAAFADLVDLESVRTEIKKKLNKDADSSVGELSDSFIHWLEGGIEMMGNQAVERLVDVSWVRARLLEQNTGDDGEGFLKQVTYAFFDAPDGFVVRIGPTLRTPVQLRLRLRGLRWRISAVYY